MNDKSFGWRASLFWFGIVVVLAIIPLLLVQDSEFGGADGAAVEAIQELQPDYEPWFTPLIEPPGGETESLLFALQAALGAGLIGYFFGVKVGQRTARNAEHSMPPPVASRQSVSERT